MTLALEVVMVLKGFYKSKFFDIFSLCSETMIVVHYGIFYLTYGESVPLREYGEYVIVVSNTYYNYLMVAIYLISVVLSVGAMIKYLYKKIKEKLKKRKEEKYKVERIKDQ